MLRKLNPFYFIINRLETLMSLAQDTKNAADAAVAEVGKLNAKVDTLIIGFQTVSTQLADLIANGSLSDADKAQLQSAVDELNGAVTSAQAEESKIDSAMSAQSGSAPSTGDTGSDTGSGQGNPVVGTQTSISGSGNPAL